MTDDTTSSSRASSSTTEGTLPVSRRGALGLAGAAIGGVALGGASVGAQESSARTYRATVANLTEYQPFTPPAIAAHDASVGVFSVGEAATEPTKAIAENGNLTPLVEFIQTTAAVDGSAVGQDGPLVPKNDPGDTGRPYSSTLEFTTENDFFSYIAMLIATNDGFSGLDTVRLPRAVGESTTEFANGYDAGTEENTERFQDLVPPAQGLTGINWEGDGTGASDPDLATDGVITPHPGIQGTGNLRPELFDWTEPVALVHVERIE